MKDVISKKQRKKNHEAGMKRLKKYPLSLKRLLVKVTAEEKDALEKEASFNGQTLTAFCRQKLTK